VPGDELWQEIAEEAYKQCHPLTNIDGDPAWRREMVRVFTRRALREALERGRVALGLGGVHLAISEVTEAGSGRQSVRRVTNVLADGLPI
jgi:hypothetical protein